MKYIRLIAAALALFVWFGLLWAAHTPAKAADAPNPRCAPLATAVAELAEAGFKAPLIVSPITSEPDTLVMVYVAKQGLFIAKVTEKELCKVGETKGPVVFNKEMLGDFAKRAYNQQDVKL
jgi:hypothetical protein